MAIIRFTLVLCTVCGILTTDLLWQAHVSAPNDELNVRQSSDRKPRAPRAPRAPREQRKPREPRQPRKRKNSGVPLPEKVVKKKRCAADAKDGEGTVELEVVRRNVVSLRQVGFGGPQRKSAKTVRARRGARWVYRTVSRISPVVGAGECLNALQHDDVVRVLSMIRGAQDHGTCSPP